MMTSAHGSAPLSSPVPTYLCASDDPLIGGEEIMDDKGAERTVQGPEKKLFFSPSTFGEGESGESVR